MILKTLSALLVTMMCHGRYDKHDFEQQSHKLIEALALQQFEQLNNANVDKAEAILAWPYQLRIVFERINELLSEIGRENRVREAVWLRGAYLMSSGQKRHQA